MSGIRRGKIRPWDGWLTCIRVELGPGRPHEWRLCDPQEVSSPAGGTGAF